MCTHRGTVFGAHWLTDRQLQKLRDAFQEHENNRWRFISSKVGSGYLAAACKDKIAELDLEGMESQETIAKEGLASGWVES